MTTLFGDSGITDAAPIDARPARKKRGWLPLLTVLFCLSYGLMTMLIVEQGSTIESQRVLIRELFRDSAELSANKLRAQQQKNALAMHEKALAEAPSAQAPSAQAPNQAPSAPRRGQNPAQKVAPQKPGPSRAVELVDARRALVTI